MSASSPSDPQTPAKIDSLLRCLVEITRRFDRPMTVSDVRAACPVPDSGMTLPVFFQAAERLGYRVREEAKAVDRLGELPLPFVVVGHGSDGARLVVGRNGDQFDVFDPARIETDRMTTTDLAGFAARVVLVGAHRAADRGTGNAAMSWRGRLRDRVRQVFGELMLASLAINVLALASPLFVMTVYNKVIGQRALATLDVMLIGMVALYGFDMILRAIRGYMSTHTGARLDALIGTDVLHRLLGLPFRHFETTPTGLINERLRQLETVRQFFTGQMPMVMVDLAFVVVFLGAVFYLHTTLGYIVLAAIPVFIALSAGFHRTQRNLAEESFVAQAAKTSALAETVANALTVKSLGLEPEIERRWGQRLAASAWTGFRTSNLSNLISVFGTVLQQIASLAIVYAGARLVISGQLSIGALIAATILASRAIQPMRQVVSAWAQLQDVRTAFRRLDDIMTVPAEAEPGALLPMGPVEGDVALESVSFRYDPDQPPTVRDLSLHVPRGSMFCIVGPSGSGKSTVAKLIQGLYTPEDGRVLIDQTDIAHVSPPSLRTQLGVVPQETQLFAGTVRDNIALGSPGIMQDRIERAARFVGAHEFIQRLPKGYDTELSERGGGISAGQRQLLCIARALVRNPRILIMDEPTSALDLITEQRLLARIRQLADERTVIVISHRAAPAAVADQVALMVEGRIEIVGTPGEIEDYARTQRPAASAPNASSKPAADLADGLARNMAGEAAE